MAAAGYPRLAVRFIHDWKAETTGIYFWHYFLHGDDMGQKAFRRYQKAKRRKLKMNQKNNAFI